MAENGSVEKVRFEDREWMLNEPFIRQLSCLIVLSWINIQEEESESSGINN